MKTFRMDDLGHMAGCGRDGIEVYVERESVETYLVYLADGDGNWYEFDGSSYEYEDFEDLASLAFQHADEWAPVKVEI